MPSSCLSENGRPRWRRLFDDAFLGLEVAQNVFICGLSESKIFRESETVEEITSFNIKESSAAPQELDDGHYFPSR